jgi:uncharacterized protein (DUF2267 family)
MRMALDYAGFIATVEEEANVAHDDAERAARATLETLGERISAGEARDIAEQLPEQLRQALIDGRDPQPFDAGEFVHRVAVREGVGEPLAKEHARAVFAALGRAIDDKELADMRAQLPSSFSDFMVAAERQHAGRDVSPEPPPAEPSRIPPADEVYDRVAERAGLDSRGARAATAAALEALGNRISGGQVDDIASWLPSELQEPLARGKAKSGGLAKPLSLEEFVQEIADLEGVDADTARRHARAVFSTLRTVIGTKEYGDMLAQVPSEYAVLLGPRP